jgi:hypothetical protein
MFASRWPLARCVRFGLGVGGCTRPQSPGGYIMDANLDLRMAVSHLAVVAIDLLGCGLSGVDLRPDSSIGTRPTGHVIISTQRSRRCCR